MVTFFDFDGGNELASSAFCSDSPILSTAYKIIAHQIKSQHILSLQTLIAHLLIYEFDEQTTTRIFLARSKETLLTGRQTTHMVAYCQSLL